VKSGLIRGVVFLEGTSLVVFFYLSVSEIWPDKRGGLSVPSRKTTPLIRPDFTCTEIAKYY
jgi:hypothetical protein